MSTPTTSPIEILLLGSGWISLSILPILVEKGLSHASTSRDGSKPGTIPFAFDPLSDDPAPYQNLPRARTIVIVFPIKGEGGSRRLVRGYESVHGGGSRWIQLGSTGIWDGEYVHLISKGAGFINLQRWSIYAYAPKHEPLDQQAHPAQPNQ